jgi:hypothetical protein
MFHITQTAGEFLEGIMTRRNWPDGSCIRLQAQQDGSGKAVVGKEENGDQTFEHNGKTVLVVNEQDAEQLSEKTLDAQQKDGSVQLVLKEQ